MGKETDPKVATPWEFTHLPLRSVSASRIPPADLVLDAPALILTGLGIFCFASSAPDRGHALDSVVSHRLGFDILLLLSGFLTTLLAFWSCLRPSQLTADSL